METLKYKIIKSKKQYNEYCAALELLVSGKLSKPIADEIELLTFLIEKWDEEHNTMADLDPVALIKALMEEHQLKAKDLADILQVSKSHMSEILSYKKGLSKEIIRNLSSYFKVSQEAFNRTYKLHLPINSHLRNSSVMNTHKDMMEA
jgi:HTH-type transcriptional regulator / antitoxin HigA